MSDAITSTKLEQIGEIFRTRADRGNILGQPMLFECMGMSAFLSPAHESEMRGYLFYVLIVKYLLILFQFSIMELGEIFEKTFLEGSVDHIIYRDYIVNRHSFIYCGLATWFPCRPAE